jgi:Tol biopolymer transport system component
LAAFAAVFAPAPTAAQTGYDLMQQALVKEQAEGNLQAAIALYERIVDEFAADHDLAARALFKMGACYEKLGRSEAQEAYRALLERYPDQTDLVARAEGRLAALAQPTEGVAEGSEQPGLDARLVWDGTVEAGVDAQGGPFPDGHRLVYIDWDTGNLAIRDLISGTSRPLTDDGAWDEGLQQYPINAVVAPDGKEVAYSWITYRHGSEAEHRYELRVADTETGRSRTLHDGSEADQVFPFAWSRDGHRILVGRYQGSDSSEPMELGTVAAEDGEYRSLKEFPGGFWVSGAFSPDGKHVVVSHPVAADSGRSDILLLATDGSAEIPLVTHPAGDHFLGWIPGTDQILFRSDRSGTWDAWALHVGPRGAEGPPRPVRRRVGKIDAMGFSNDGTLFYSTFTRWFDLTLAPFDVATGAVDFGRTEPLLGSNFQPLWSPRGRRLAFVQESNRDGNGASRALHLWDPGTGEDRVLAPGLDVIDPRWSPDGRSLVVTGRRAGDESESFYVVDTENGDAEKVLDVPTRGAWWLGRADWAPGGDAIVYTLFERLVRHDLRTGEERTLFQHPRLIGTVLALSPDGKWLALGIGSPTWTGNPHAELTRGGSVVVLPASGGEPREIARLSAPGRVRTNFAWAPDGQSVYVLQRDFDEKKTRLWRAPVDAGGAEEVWDADRWLVGLAIDPGGDRAAVSTYTQETQIWTLKGLKETVRERN